MLRVSAVWQCPAAQLLITSHHAHSGWPAGPKLRNRRFSTAAGVVDGCVYVTGGYDGSYLKVGVLQFHGSEATRSSCIPPGLKGRNGGYAGSR